MKKREGVEPISSALDVSELGEIITYTGNFNRLAENSARVASLPTAYVTQDDEEEKYIIDYVSNSSRIRFRVPYKLKGISGNSSRAEDVFTFILSKLTDRAVELWPDGEREVSFRLQELVDYGLFSDISNARRALCNTYYAIEKIDVEITTKRAKRFTHLISATEIENGIVTVTLGKYLEWDRFKEAYVSVPLKNMFSLSYKASSVCKGIYYQIRKKAEPTSLVLPTSFIVLKANIPIDKKNPKRVKERVKSIIDEINNCEDLRIKIVPKYSDEGNLLEWIKKGVFIVYVRGYLSNDMKAIAKSRAKKAEAVEI